MKKLLFIVCIIIVFSCSDQAGPDLDSSFIGKVILTNFAYTGTHTVYFSVLRGEGDDNFPDITHSSATYVPYSASLDTPGTSDILVADIDYHDPDHIDEGSELGLWLVAASDEDDSGHLTDGDFILPLYRFNLKNGQTMEIEGLTLDTGSTLGAGPYGPRNFKFRITDNLPAVVDADHPVILRIDNAGNTDFKNNAPNFRQIVIADRRLLGSLMIASVPDITDDYVMMLGYDRNGNGTLDIDDYATETDTSAVTYTINIIAGDYSDQTIEFVLNDLTAITN
jgi:hypothetical protein